MADPATLTPEAGAPAPAHPDHPAGAALGMGDPGVGALRTISTTPVPTGAPTLAARCGGGTSRSPYESGLAAVARPDIHIERVWPMRSPSTGVLEATSSNVFQPEQCGAPPAASPVEGLRMSQAFSHRPVMVREVVDLLGPVPAGVVLDATAGGGGHAAALLEAAPHLDVLALDRDPAAVTAATERLARFGARAAVRRARFDQLGTEVRSFQRSIAGSGARPGLVGVLFDLGVSSPQLDRADRGFSYRQEAPLDMRMDPTSGPTAGDVVNGWDEPALARLFAENGEGRFAGRIARAIVAHRPVTTTTELAEIVRTAIPAATRRTGGHPARRVFQAVRIAVNEELDQLQPALEQALDLLRPGGRCVVLSYHSGEDRVVKQTFLRATTGGCTCPPGLPCVCGATPLFRALTRGARRPAADEVGSNPRAEAARLRAVERVGTDEAPVRRITTARPHREV